MPVASRRYIAGKASLRCFKLQVKNVLEESFGLYWLNLASCANRIRISIEVLLTELRKTATNKSILCTFIGIERANMVVSSLSNFF